MAEFKKEFLKKLSKNKVSVLIVFFALWILFFDQNSMIEQYKYSEKIKNLQKQIEYYEGKYKTDSAKLQLLKTDVKSFESFAREEFYMHSDDEEVFIIQKQSK